MKLIGNYPESFRKELYQFYNTVKENTKSKLEIDNESSRMKEKYGLNSKLNEHGYKVLKRILDKFWSGKRLDDQELAIAYVLCPKIILYEQVQFRILDMVQELEQECMQRWGQLTPPLKSSRAINKMTENNTDFLDSAIPLIDSVWKKIPIDEAIEQWNTTMSFMESRKQ